MILYCDVIAVEDPATKVKSTQRIIRTKPSQYFEAGDRTGRLPETLPLNFEEFLKAFNLRAMPAKAPVAK